MKRLVNLFLLVLYPVKVVVFIIILTMVVVMKAVLFIIYAISDYVNIIKGVIKPSWIAHVEGHNINQILNGNSEKRTEEPKPKPEPVIVPIVETKQEPKPTPKPARKPRAKAKPKPKPKQTPTNKSTISFSAGRATKGNTTTKKT